VLLAGAVAIAGCSASGGSDKSTADRAAAPAAEGPGNGPAAPSEARSGDGAASDGSAKSGNGATAGGGTEPGAKAPALAPTYLVRTADLSVRTPHVADALQKARTLAADAGGYAGDENTEVDAAGHADSSIQLRVPPAAYDQLLGDLAALGTLLERKVSVQDVTSQVVDVTSRIKSQQASVDRVRKLMDQASGLTDVVSLESELSTRESALESLEAQQASLRAQADLATVTLRLSEPPVKAVAHKAPPKKHDGFWTSVGHALGDGWHAFYVTLRAVSVAVSAVLPFLAVAVLVWVGYRLMRRRWPRAVPPAATLRAPDGLPRHPAVPGGPRHPPMPGSVPRRPPVPGPREDLREDPWEAPREAPREEQEEREEQGPPVG
jgi:hypothetical protein